MNFSPKVRNIYGRNAWRGAPEIGGPKQVLWLSSLNTSLCITVTMILYENTTAIEHVVVHHICVLSHLMCACKHGYTNLSLYH